MGLTLFSHFTKNLGHAAGSFNIFLHPLEEITNTIGIYVLTLTNYLGYDNVKESMSTALYLILSNTDYFKYFSQASTHARAAAANSNRFQLIYRILEVVHPRICQSMGGIYKIIHVPSYNNISDDNIYTLLTGYQKYLVYESFSTESCSYN